MESRVRGGGRGFADFVGNNAMPCGTTTAVTATRLGILTVDVGVGLLSMHSAREMSHVDDLLDLSRVLEAYWAGRLTPARCTRSRVPDARGA